MDDARQIKRWHNFAGANGRVKQSLVRQLRGRWNRSIGPKTRQALQHWAYELTEEDFLREIESKSSKPEAGVGMKTVFLFSLFFIFTNFENFPFSLFFVFT